MEKVPLHFDVRGTVGPARASVLGLPHGEVLTPVFMPVGTQVRVIVSKVTPKGHNQRTHVRTTTYPGTSHNFGQHVPLGAQAGP